MKEIIELALRSFWHFIGFMSILYMCLYFPFNFVLQIIHKNIRAKTIREKGYPPEYCDGDGDFKKEED